MLEKAVNTTRRGNKSTSVQYARFADDMVILIDAQRRSDWLVKAVDRQPGSSEHRASPRPDPVVTGDLSRNAIDMWPWYPCGPMSSYGHWLKSMDFNTVLLF
jgi:hypothetical protein